MTISENEIHIYRFSLESTSDQIKESETVLSPDELWKAYQYKFEKDKFHYISGRALLRKLLAKYLDQAPGNITFSYSEKGKPFINGNNIKFNLAHSGGKAVFAFTNNSEVGIDIEFMRELSDALQIAKRFFSDGEVKEFSEIIDCDIRTAFFNCWTRKEAFIKALGEGLSYPLNDFSVTLKPGEKPEVKWIKGKDAEVKKWSLFNIEVDEKYVSSLAVKAKEVSVIYL
ncbi:MAG TPA: 4'-phosphopantetheinyl transferase superfamily protein [Ignavibacteria bacterium]|nr:4'-phosphopantetheinyl transferase superfamily protein [Ignavibacteria bacterium]